MRLIFHRPKIGLVIRRNLGWGIAAVALVWVWWRNL